MPRSNTVNQGIHGQSRISGHAADLRRLSSRRPHPEPSKLQLNSRVISVAVGHISGTSSRDLLRTDEKHQDLSRRSGHMHGVFAVAREALVQDLAY